MKRSAGGSLILAALLFSMVAGCGGGDDSVELSPEDQVAFNNIQATLAITANASAEFNRLVAAEVSDPVADLIAYLRNVPNVASVELSPDGSTVIVTATNGESIAIVTDSANSPYWIAAGDSVPARVQAADVRPPLPPQQAGAGVQAILGAGSIICDPTTFPQSNKALLLTNFDRDFGTGSEFKSDMKAILERSGYVVQNHSIKTVEDIAKLQEYLADSGVIYISSHGHVSKSRAGVSGNMIATEIRLDDEASMAKLKNLFGANARKYLGLGRDGSTGVYYWTLSPEFFASIKYKNSMVFMDACHSDSPVGEGGVRLDDAFRQNGAGAYFGWKDSVHTELSKSVAKAVFRAMSPEQVAIASIALRADPPDPAPRQSYVPSATVSPATQIELTLSVSGTDGYSKTETKTTGEDGTASFGSVPGGQGGVVDTLTVNAGGANNAATAVNVVKSDPGLQIVWKLKFWKKRNIKVTELGSYAGDKFNIVCNNIRVTDTETVVKF